MVKPSRLLSSAWLAAIILMLLACQRPPSLPASTGTIEPTLTHLPSPTISPISSSLKALPTPLILHTMPSQACLVGDVPIQSQKLWLLDGFEWSPTGDSLAYIGPSEITDSLTGTLMLVSAPRFDTPRLLAPNAIGDPAWSLDGSHLAFVAFRSYDQWGTVMVVRADGSGLRDLLPGESARTDPGTGYKAIVGWLDEHRILILGNCGAGCTRPLQLNCRDNTLRPMVPPGQEGVNYAWSPGQTAVVVTSGANPQIGVALEVGGEVCWLSGHKAFDASWGPFWTFFVDWSPDSSRFLFLRQPNDTSEPSELWVWDVAAKAGSRLLPGAIAASWSPQGNLVAFVLLGQLRFSSDGTWQGVTAAPEGPNSLGLGLCDWHKGGIIAFTTVSEVNLGYRRPEQLQSPLLKPMWSPDGKMLAYYDGVDSIYILSVNDLSQYKLDTHGEPINELGWSPDGKKLAVSTPDHLWIFAIPCL